MTAIAVRNTARSLISLCGVNDVVQFNVSTSAQRISEEMLDNDFTSFIDKDFNEIDADLKSYSTLTVHQRQIRLQPGTKRSIKALVQLGRDMIRTNQNPGTAPPPILDTALLTRRYTKYKTFTHKTSTISDAAKPSRLTAITKWTTRLSIASRLL